MSLIEAKWIGGGVVKLASGQTVGPGDTAMIGEAEAHESDNWQPVVKPASTGRSTVAAPAPEEGD